MGKHILYITMLLCAYWIACEIPEPPPSTQDASVGLGFERSNGEKISSSVLEDTTDKTIKICLYLNFTELLDSVKLSIISVTDTQKYPINSYTLQFDTVYYPITFSKSGNYKVILTGYAKGVPITVSGTILIVDRPQAGQNHEPVLSVPTSQKIGAGQTLIFTVSATDPDANQIVTITAPKKPNTAIFEADTFKWTPAIGDTGTDTVIFIAIDDYSPAKSDTEFVVIEISSVYVNQAPKWISRNIQKTIVPGELFTYDLSDKCYDPDNEPITFSILSALPALDTIINKVYTFTPFATDTGKYTVFITSRDSSGLEDTLTLELSFLSNSAIDTIAPVFTRVSPAHDSTTVFSSTIQVSVTCKDESGIDSVKCSMGSREFDVTKSGDSTYTATVTGLLPTEWNTVTFLAKDASPAKNPRTLLVHLKYDNTLPDSVPPVITFQTPSKNAVIGVDTIEVKVNCLDDSGISSVKGYCNGIFFEMKKTASVPNLWTGTAKGLTAGIFSTINVVATDSSKAGNKDSTSLQVKYDNDKAAPTILLVTPAKDSVTTNTSSYTIVLKVTDPSGVLSVNGTVETISYTGVRDTGSTWKINIGTLENNKATAIVLTAIDSSLRANKALDTIYVTSKIINGYTVTFDKNDSIASGTMAKQTINSEDSAALTANAFTKTGWKFDGWATSPAGPVSFKDGAIYKMGTGNVVLYAKWKINTFELSATTGTGGTISAPASSPVIVNYGVATTIKASASNGYQFVDWTITPATAGTITDKSSASTAVTLYNANATVKANFTEITYELTMSNDGHGSTTPAAGKSTVKQGAATTISATPNPGYEFSNWTITPSTAGTISNTNTASTSVTLNSANATVKASFTIKAFSLSISASHGSVIKSPNQTQYDSGTVVSLTAVPAAGYEFAGWSGALTGNTNPTSIKLDGPKSVTANFTIKTFTLSVAGLNGSVTKEPNATQYDSGTVVTLTAVAASGYQFSGWSGALTGSANPTFITMNAAKTVTATFSKTYSVTYNANGGGLPFGHGSSGTVPLDPNRYAPDDAVTVLDNTGTLTKAAYVWDGWSLSVNGAKVTSFKMSTNNVILYARWVIKDRSGNTYTEDTIGNQIWLVENLRTTMYNDGTNIPVMPEVPHEYLQAAGYYNNNGDVYYSGLSVSTGLLAPEGWHVPTQAEWDELSTYVSNSAKALASKGIAPKTWFLGSGTDVGAVPGTNNSSGFTATPDGTYFSSIENYHAKACFWISDLFSTVYGMTQGNAYVINYDEPIPAQESFRADYGLSVRCIRDF